ncbi:BadF/BadG/BcrA/BcrD ATPase family protein [Streptomyces sp. NPDC089799]|uniref:BadF/BadG/BcrA/BcrD ATPase family protein n=1 Tax=Streptomyces sp. NPDC089799 TaxID=3155066 RepID=UPI0034363552
MEDEPLDGVWVAGLDVGGTGLRLALARLDGHGGARTAASVAIGAATRTGPHGIDAGTLLGLVLPALDGLLAEAGADAVEVVAVGATGMASLGEDLAARLPGPLAERAGARRLVLAADAVAAYAGALGVRPGVVVAAGTGMIALATGPAGGWRRADGWGHLFGDGGGGAWIGRAAVDAALRAYDGRSGGSVLLLDRVVELYGAVAGLPAVFQRRPDRAGLLAALAPAVAGAAAAGDGVAAGILARAAEEIADTAAAAAVGLTAPRISLTGRLFDLAGLRAAVSARLAERVPGVRPHVPDGDPLQGTLRLAAAAVAGPMPWPEGAPLLRVLTVR